MKEVREMVEVEGEAGGALGQVLRDLDPVRGFEDLHFMH